MPSDGDRDAAPTLAGVADELYGLAPDGFTAARDGRARELRGTDRELAAAVKALRRPAAAAWAVNALVRAHGAVVADLLGLGAALRAAQEALAGDELRRLGREQRAALAGARSLLADVAADAGQPLTEATWRQVEGTLRAAMADADAAAAVASGRLVAPLDAAGFGGVDVGEAVAVPGAPPVLAGVTSKPQRRRGAKPERRPARSAPSPPRPQRPAADARVALRQAEAALAEAEQAASAAQAGLDAARAEADGLARRRAEIADRLGELGEEMDRLRAEDRKLSRAEHDARPVVTDAEGRVRSAVRALEQARARRERLGRDDK